jgi:hypothetical protein
MNPLPMGQPPGEAAMITYLSARALSRAGLKKRSGGSGSARTQMGQLLAGNRRVLRALYGAAAAGTAPAAPSETCLVPQPADVIAEVFEFRRSAYLSRDIGNLAVDMNLTWRRSLARDEVAALGSDRENMPQWRAVVGQSCDQDLAHTA